MTAEWTWLVYMAGDNNLEGAGRLDLGEMQRVGSTPQVNVLVQFDTEEQKTMRYRVEKGRATTLQTMRGVDCGDPKVLTDFIRWGAAKYPARRYALVVWNHGGGWEDGDFDYNANRSPKPIRASRMQRARRTLFRTTREQLNGLPVEERAIAIDCGAQDYLDNQELRQAVENGGQKLDLFGCDACLMNMVEIAYEMKDTAAFMVGSEQTEPNAGWPYTDILGPLAANPAMATADLAHLIVDRYGAWYRQNGDPGQDVAATQSAIDLGKVNDLAGAVDGLAKALVDQGAAARMAIAYARSRTLQFEIPDYIDLGDLANRLAQAVPAVKAASKDVLEALGTTVVRNALWGNAVARAQGASIFFPQNDGRLIPDYKKLRFGASNTWTSFLATYFDDDKPRSRRRNKSETNPR